MGDYFYKIVPVTIEATNPLQEAEAIITWLQNRSVIETEPSDCVLGAEPGYRPGRNFAEIVADGYDKEQFKTFLSLKTNGFETTTGRTVFDAGQGGLNAVICSYCKSDIIDGNWSDFLTEWHAGKSSNYMACDNCKTSLLLNTYQFVVGDTRWAFSNLGFTFWNLPHPYLKEEFIKEFEECLGKKVLIVQGKL